MERMTELDKDKTTPPFLRDDWERVFVFLPDLSSSFRNANYKYLYTSLLNNYKIKYNRKIDNK